jgi:hypothetical protein
LLVDPSRPGPAGEAKLASPPPPPNPPVPSLPNPDWLDGANGDAPPNRDAVVEPPKVDVVVELPNVDVVVEPPNVDALVEPPNELTGAADDGVPPKAKLDLVLSVVEPSAPNGDFSDLE